MTTTAEAPIRPLSAEELRQIAGGQNDSEWRYVPVRRFQF